MLSEEEIMCKEAFDELKKENEQLKITVNKQSIDISNNLLGLQQKDKQIDLMAESIELQQYANIDTSNLDLVCEKLKCNKKCELVKEDCIKQYFENKVNSSEQN